MHIQFIRVAQNMKQNIRQFSRRLIPLLLIAPNIAFAQQVVFLGVINNIINWALGLLITLAVAVVIWAAYVYLTAGGNAERVRSANKFLVYVAIAVGVALLSKAFVVLVIELVGTSPVTLIPAPSVF
jgi:cation transport ATPase